MAVTATLDKATYAAGDTMRLTVESDLSDPVTVTVQVGGEAPVTATGTRWDEVTVTDPDRTWTEEPGSRSDTGVVYTATA